ncbi:hypothetical protein NLU13_5676 [Sarocladium strictum]|uniref:AB hydrolase-1 domain-containing protein n=1 Tax=Sarocladium strictum TaxID=5046 RepID=A0AA39L7V9_SARSR|nr:hypothetical protein NLU13_5676 [Sarocladium strictum]
MTLIAIPRPGAAAAETPQPPIPAPSEEAFTTEFGRLLPPARFLTTKHGKAAYYEMPPSQARGDGNNIPERVLFVHGVQTPALGMLPLAHALRPSFPQSHFVLVDLWGHGLSDAVREPHEPGLFHSLIDSLLDELKWPSVHLIGFSFGGALAVGYTLARTSRVSTLTLVAPAGLIPYASLSEDDRAKKDGDDEDAGQRWSARWLDGGDLVVPEDWKEKVAKGEIVAPAVKKWQMVEHRGHPATVRAVVRDGGIFDVDSQANFKAVVNAGVPYYGIVGELDGVCSDDDLKKVGFEHFSVVQGVGHEVVRARADEVAALITDFWGKQHWLDRV